MSCYITVGCITSHSNLPISATIKFTLSHHMCLQRNNQSENQDKHIMLFIKSKLIYKKEQQETNQLNIMIYKYLFRKLTIKYKENIVK